MGNVLSKHTIKEYYKAKCLLMNYLYSVCVLKLLAALHNLIVKIIQPTLDNLMTYNADKCISYGGEKSLGLAN